jgi:3-oxoacyl-[acyl-carrier protein] reductase
VDVADEKSVAQGTAAAATALGKIDILVNNAGIAGVTTPVIDYPVDEWERVLKIDLTGPFLCARAVAPHMVRQKYGRIVNIASIAGKEGNPNMTGYSATKAAVIAFTKSLAKEVALDGICVNSVTPAVIRTKILDQLTQAQIDYMTDRIPMRRTGTPEEIAAVAHFLASPDCSFVTAQCYDASGGRATY